MYLTKNRIRIFFILLLAGLFLTLYPSGHVYAKAEKPYKTCSPKEVHPIWWKARINYDVKAKVIGSSKKITLSKGKKVTLISNNRTGKKKIMLKNGTRCTVPAGAVTAYEDACTKGDYSKKTKIAFVNSRTIRSKTNYLIWVSTDMQSLNVFKGRNKHWKFVKTYKCSTGMADYPTPIGLRSIVAKMRVCHSTKWGSNLQYFLSFGGSGIHQWPGSGAVQNLGKHPCSHACIRLGRTQSQWMFKHIPVNTRLLIY